MKYLPRPVLLVFAAGLAFSGCAATVHVDQTGPDTYTLTAVPGSGFERDRDAVKEKAKAEAEKYCESRGKVLKVLSLDTKKPLYLTGYVTATIQFQALPPGDPRLNEPAPAATAPSMGNASAGSYSYSAPAPAPAPAPATSNEISGDMYNQLLKLDDLRKRGILTQEEFDAEKKKILARSQ